MRDLLVVQIVQRRRTWGQFVNMDGEEGSVVRLVTELLQEDVTYEFIAHIAKCPLETVKEIAANTKYNKE